MANDTSARVHGRRRWRKICRFPLNYTRSCSSGLTHGAETGLSIGRLRSSLLPPQQPPSPPLAKTETGRSSETRSARISDVAIVRFSSFIISRTAFRSRPTERRPAVEYDDRDEQRVPVSLRNSTFSRQRPRVRKSRVGGEKKLPQSWLYRFCLHSFAPREKLFRCSR